MAKEMLINVSEGEECRIALLEDGKLEELYMERTSSTSHIGNIYKGRVTNVEPSIQAAFIDFGIGKNGFLHISDVHPQYFPKKMQPRMPQQRGGGRQQRAPQTATHVPQQQPAAGFQPPPAPTSDSPDAAQSIAPTANETVAPQTDPQAIAHSIATDTPAVGFEAPAADASAPVNEESTLQES